MNVTKSPSYLSPLLGLALIAAPLLSGCGGGGGGGGDDFIGAAQLSMTASPRRIDTGDRTEVRIDISRLHPNGIALKIRFPAGLDYVTSSSVLEVDDTDIDVTPSINQEKASDVYLVYYISPEQIEEEATGVLLFELEGKKELKEGSIEVDADVDDPEIDNATEFDIDKPQFGAEQEVTIEVTE